jgi:hypothetical protein
MLALFDHAVAEGFVRTLHRAMVLAESDPDVLLNAMERYAPPAVEKWLDASRT